jgi:hypothetical protein
MRKPKTTNNAERRAAINEYTIGLIIKKLDADTYAFSGKPYKEKDERGEQRDVIFIYRRSTGRLMHEMTP